MPESIPPIFAHSLTIVSSFKYVFVFFGALVEGPLVMMASGFLLHFKIFKIVPLLSFLIIGDLCGDVFWYYLGYFFAEPFLRKHGKFMGVTLERFEKIKIIFHKYQSRILIISKITMGFGMALGTLMAAGASKVPFKKYISLNALGEPIFVTILVSAGYFFAKLYSYVESGFKIGFMIFIIILALSFLYGFSKYIRSKFLKK